MIPRKIKDLIKSTSKSVLLLGPRQTGKTTIIESLKVDLIINLADELEYLNFSSKPDLLKKMIVETNAGTIAIDEIQRIPSLLNTIQTIIDKNRSIKFYLTGSSARKLRKGQANLLPGRAVNFYLGPLVASEVGYQMNSHKALELGTLPEAYTSENNADVIRVLKSYAANYIKEEIKAEALVRNLESFTRFFQETVLFVAEFIDYTKLANRSKISRHAIPRYFEILEDSLIATRLFPYLKDHTEELIKHPKFYFFDNGVYNGLIGNFVASADRIGKLAEQLVLSQLIHSAWANELQINIYSFRTRKGIEVDFIVELNSKLFAIEVKTSDEINSEDLEGLKHFKEIIKDQDAKLFVFHFGTKEQIRSDIQIVPWQLGLKLMKL